MLTGVASVLAHILMKLGGKRSGPGPLDGSTPARAILTAVSSMSTVGRCTAKVGSESIYSSETGLTVEL